jgi:hypothetical protein
MCMVNVFHGLSMLAKYREDPALGNDTGTIVRTVKSNRKDIHVLKFSQWFIR